MTGSNGSNGNGNGELPSDLDELDEDAGVSLAGAHTVVMDLDETLAPGKIVELAANAVRFILAATRVEPDFSRESLALVDHYVREARASIRERPETLPLTSQALGAYLGEVIRGTHRCWWRLDPKDPGASRLEFGQVYLAFYPVQVAHVSLTCEEGSEAFSGFELEPGDLAALLGRLGQLPEMSEEMYFAPTTKVEVVDIAVDALLAKRAQSPDTARPYLPVDYEAR